MTQVGEDAAWRSQPLSNDELLQRILENNQRISPIFTVPWVTSRIFRKDWLHCADQGVTSEFIGNLFHYLRDKLEGRTVKLRTARLWERVQNFYNENNVQDRLQALTPTMIKMDKKGPVLRSSAAQCRALVPFASEIAQDLLSPANPKEQSMIAATLHLKNCYDALPSGSIFLQTSSEKNQKIALQYVALRAVETDDKLWKCKPKLHIFVELCSEGSKPATFWTYRDEDFDGSVAKTSKRREGKKGVQAYSMNTLSRFLIKQPVIGMKA